MKEIEELINEYIKVSVDRGEAIKKGNSKVANKCFDKINKIILQLKSRNSLVELMPLLEYSNNYVRLDTACILISIYSEECKKTLQQLIDVGGMVGFTAKMTIQEWEKGNIRPL